MGLFEDCNGCTERVVGCHATCERYARAKSKNDKIVAARRADGDCRAYAYNIKMDNMAKQAMKRKRKVDVRLNYK